MSLKWKKDVFEVTDGIRIGTCYSYPDHFDVKWDDGTWLTTLELSLQGIRKTFKEKELSPISPSDNAHNEMMELKDALDKLQGCPCCGGKLCKIRGKYPEEPEREICPICIVEKLEDLVSQLNVGQCASTVNTKE